MFGNSTSSRSASAMVRSTPPGVGPGRYEQPSFKVEARSGESVAGFSAFLGPERACNKKTVTSALGPGSHRPELYTAMVRPQSQPPPAPWAILCQPQAAPPPSPPPRAQQR